MEEKYTAEQREEQYVFVSYSHEDKERVEQIIRALSRVACRIWYDEKISPGNHWNEEIALKLAGARAVLWFVSRSSVCSEYVADELSFAKNRKIAIYPVCLEDATLPIGLELLLGRVQRSVNIEGCDPISARNKIVALLPNEVFFTCDTLFYMSKKNLFYFENTSCPFPEGGHLAGEEDSSFEICARNDYTGEVKRLYRFRARPIYESDFRITQVKPYSDRFFTETDEIVLFNVTFTFICRYPASLPDFDLMVTYLLKDINSDEPSLSAVYWKAIRVNGEEESADEKTNAFINGVIEDIVRVR